MAGTGVERDYDRSSQSAIWRQLLSPRALLTIAGFGIAFALTAAALDQALAYGPLPARFADVSTAGLVFATAAAKTLATYALLSVALLLPLSLLLEPNIPSTCAVLGIASIGATGVMWSFTDWHLSIVDLYKSLALLLALAWLLYFAFRRGTSAASDRRFVVAALLAAAAAAFEVAGFLWLSHFPLREQARSASGLFVAAFAVMVFATWLPAGWFGRRRPSRLVLVAVALLTTIGPVRSLLTARAPGPPVRTAEGPSGSIDRVILLTIDSLRYDAISAAGHGGPPTPKLDQLAEDSVLFRNAVAPASWTLPSMTALMSGVPPHLERGFVRGAGPGRAPRGYRLAPLPTLADRFREAGFTTQGFAADELLAHPRSVVRGFHRMDTFASDPIGRSSPGATTLQRRYPSRYTTGGTGRELSDEAIAWVRQHRDERFFLWVHYHDPHLPYAPPSEHVPDGITGPVIYPGLRSASAIATHTERARARMLYDSEVRYVDLEIGRFLEQLRSLGIYDDALILLTGDHGEEFWEHGLHGHGSSLYRESLNVPLLIKQPDNRLGGEKVDAIVPTLAVMPTVLELCQLETEQTQAWADSLVPLLEDVSGTYERPIVSAGTLLFDVQRSVIVDDFKFIRRVMSERDELYDLGADPGETRSVVEQHPDVVEKAGRILDEYVAWAASLRAEHGL